MVGPVDDLVHAAQSATRAGRLDAAALAWDRVLASSPNHPQALVFLGQHAARRGDVRGAVQLLERAAKTAPNDPLVALNLAHAYRAAGDTDREMVALTTALTADPYCYPALLARGEVLERTGQHRNAARVYRDALKIVPADDKLSPELRASVERARRAVQENIAALDAFLAAKLGPAREPRISEATDAMIGKSKIYVSEASLFRVPRLPALPFFDREYFPWLADFEAQTPAIREELMKLLATKQEGFHPYIQYGHDVPLHQWEELNNNVRWSSLDLWKDGRRIEEHASLCPRTMAALENVPLCFVSGVTPCALFSALQPHTHIPAHAGVTNARSLLHLPLIIPGPARFRVGNDVRVWEEGKAWVFDDTIEHEAWNDADQLRVIMIIDIWNPLLSTGEREQIAAAISGYYEFYRDA